MGFISVQQIWAIVLFLAGAGILSAVNKKERKKEAELKDPKKRWERIQGDQKITTVGSTGGSVMTILGALMSMGGIILFLMNINAG